MGNISIGRSTVKVWVPLFLETISGYEEFIFLWILVKQSENRANEQVRLSANVSPWTVGSHSRGHSRRKWAKAAVVGFGWPSQREKNQCLHVMWFLRCMRTQKDRCLTLLVDVPLMCKSDSCVAWPHPAGEDWGNKSLKSYSNEKKNLLS